MNLDMSYHKKVRRWNTMVWDMWVDFGASKAVREGDFEVNVVEKAEVFFLGRI